MERDGYEQVLRGQLATEKIRAKIGQITITGRKSESIEQFKKLAQDTFNKYIANEVQLEEDVKNIVSDHLIQGNIPTNSTLSVDYLNMRIGRIIRGTYQHLLVASERKDDFEQKAASAVVMDFYKGYSLPLAAVSIANQPISNNTLEEMSKIASSTEDVDLFIIQAFSIFPHQNVSHLLEEDPTGFKVIQWQLDAMRNGLFKRSYEDRDFVTAGAQLSSRHYRKIYPTVERMMPAILSSS